MRCSSISERLPTQSSSPEERDRGDAEAGVEDRVAYAVRAHAAGPGGADDGGGDGVLLGALGAGGEREHVVRLELAGGGLQLGQLGLAEEQGAAGAEHGDADAAGAVPGVGALVDDAPAQAEEDAAGDVRGRDGGDDRRAQRSVDGEGDHRHLDRGAARQHRGDGADDGGDHGPALGEQARGVGDLGEHVGAPARIDEHPGEGPVEAGPGAHAAELAAHDAGARRRRRRPRGGGRAWWRRSRGEPRRRRAVTREVDRDHLAGLDEDHLARAQVEDLELAPLPVLGVAPPGDRERRRDPGALGGDLLPRALREPGGHRRRRHQDAGERRRLGAERAVAPEGRPDGGARARPQPRPAPGRVRIAGVARGGRGPTERACPRPTPARTMRAAMTRRASPASVSATASEPATTAITSSSAPTSRGLGRRRGARAPR